ncbi:hypothetical protein OG735_01700 [Streptomyces sp. NBC_01210]|nr:hypothetical protein OG735_01700 [Streptomyces sp. NBC_01210]
MAPVAPVGPTVGRPAWLHGPDEDDDTHGEHQPYELRAESVRP